MEADVTAASIRKGVGEFPWIVLIQVPATAFFSAIATAAGLDFYRPVKELIQRIWLARERFSGTQGSILLRDADSHIMAILEPDLPDEAYQKLAALDLSSFRKGPVRYDRDKGEWWSVIDSRER